MILLENFLDKTVTSVTNSARPILASYQSTGYTPPLKEWNVLHQQVNAYEMKNKNSPDNWVAFTSGSKVTTEMAIRGSNP